MSSRARTFKHNGVTYAYDISADQYYRKDDEGRWERCERPDVESSDEDGSQSSDEDNAEDESEDDNAAQAPRTVPTATREAAAQMSGLSVGSGRSNTDKRGLFAGVNPATGVRSAQQYGPPDMITPPELARQGGEAYAMIRNAGSADERLDSSFRPRQRRFFVVGRVFSLMWAEPAGTTRVSANTILGINGQYVHQKIRRMIVIVEGENACTALPILTHGARGAAAPGVTKAFQGIIFSTRNPPAPLPGESPQQGERGMLPHAIRVNLDDRNAALHPMSRIDYGKPHSVEQNLPVKNLGLVHDASLQHLVDQARLCLAARVGITRRGRSTDGTASNAGPSRARSPPGYTTGDASHAQTREATSGSRSQNPAGGTEHQPRTGPSREDLEANRNTIIQRLRSRGYDQASAQEEFDKLLRASQQATGVDRLANTNLDANRAVIIQRLRDRGLSQSAAEEEFEKLRNAKRGQ